MQKHLPIAKADKQQVLCKEGVYGASEQLGIISP